VAVLMQLPQFAEHIAQENQDENNCQWLQTGDVLLIQGKGWRARLIQWFTRCAYSHVGLVYRQPITHKLYLLESVGQSDSLRCALANTTQRSRSGVRLVSLEDRLSRYLLEQNTAWAKIRICVIKSVVVKPATRERAHMMLDDFVGRVISAGYEDSAVHLLHNSLPALMSTPDPLDQLREYNCAELVACALQQMRIYNAELNASHALVPRNFLDGTLHDPRYQLDGYLEDPSLAMHLEII